MKTPVAAKSPTERGRSRGVSGCCLTWLLACLPLCLAGAARAQESEQALAAFAGYEYGPSKTTLHVARLAVFRATQDPAIRLARERQLLAFVESPATVAARREACLWLGQLGSEAAAPALTRLAGQAEFADVAGIALEAIRGGKPAAPAAASPLARFRAEVLASSRPLALLTPALLGGDEARARLALQMVRDGVAAPAAAAWLAEHMKQLAEDRQVVALNILAQLGAPEAVATAAKLAREGRGQVRLLAIRLLGKLGSEPDAAYLRQVWLGKDEPAAEAARAALLELPEEAVRSSLLEALGSADPRAQERAIDLASARGAGFAAEALLGLAATATNPNCRAAILALGKAAPPEFFPRVLQAWVAAEDGPLAADFQTAAWELARRQSDPVAAIRLLDAAGAGRPEPTVKPLKAMAARLAGIQPKVSLEDVNHPKPLAAAGGDLLLPGSFREVLPKRFEVAAYLDCGLAGKAEGGGVAIECLNGKPWMADIGMDPSLSLHFAAAALEYRISGLASGTDYVLGLTWWDSELNGRRQSVWIGGEEVLPDTPAVGFQEKGRNTLQNHQFSARPTPIRIQFALLPKHIRNGVCQVRIARSAGPNAVTSEIWIARRRLPRAEKQVLLVSGQDYPGHHWRQTGMAMAELIAQDERMEVTVCESPGAVGLQHLSGYDVVFMHFKNYTEDMPATQLMKQRLCAYVMGGGGMCLSHFACGAFMEWPEFVQLSGRIWNGQGHDRRGPFTVKVVDPQHPVTRGLGASFDTDDELYFCLTGDPAIHLLCTAFSQVKKADQPQAFVHEPGKGRVFLSTLGHDVRAFEPEAVKRLYRQGTAWAAGLP